MPLRNAMLCLVVSVGVRLVFQLVFKLLTLELTATGGSQDRGLAGEAVLATGTASLGAMGVEVDPGAGRLRCRTRRRVIVMVLVHGVSSPSACLLS
jgi:hypothetical protein